MKPNIEGKEIKSPTGEMFFSCENSKSKRDRVIEWETERQAERLRDRLKDLRVRKQTD